MAESLYSPLWYRVAQFKPKLHLHVRVERQLYRNQTWYLLRDSTSGRHHRVNELGYQFVGRLDGRLSVEQIWNLLAEELGERSPTQDAIVQTLIQLTELELIQPERNPEFADLFRRREERARKRWSSDVNPLAFKVRLFDPSYWLSRFAGVAKPLFSTAFLVAWSVLVLAALLATRSNWDVIAAHAATDVLTPRFLLLTWLCYPFIKLVHEFAHAFAVKVQGGEVHEMGVRVLFLTPVPYVDASAANGFRNKWQRIVVSTAGIMAELFLAALALFLWISVENGLVKDIAFVTMFIGGVSTVFFNGNPLLRFDGYYALADLLDLPNLGQRSNAYWVYLAQRYLCRLRSSPCPANTLSERLWFLGYGCGALIYRWLVSIWIVLWVSAKSVVLAVALIAWFMFALVAKPIAATARFLMLAPQLARGRARAIATTVLFLTAITAAVVWLPLPSSTLAQGVVWLPEQARIRTQTDGFIKEILVRDGSAVRAGQTLALLEAPDLVAQRNELAARLESLEAQYQQALGTSPGAAAAAEQAREQASAELARIEQRLGALRIDSPAEGTLVMPHQDDLHDSFVQRGSVLAHLLTDSTLEVRVAVPHGEAGLVRDRHERIEVRLTDRAGVALPARLLREVPAATNVLPTAALSDRYGGSITTDPQDPDALRTLEPVFLFDIAVPTERFQRAGARAWVRIDHGREPLATQWARGFRRVVLRHFAVQS
jgi:putative peptide zinc metalloprotease protein